MAERERFDFFDDGMKVYAICADLGMSYDQTRLFSYIHARAHIDGKGINYFDEPDSLDREAIEIMLGIHNKALSFPSILFEDERGHEAINTILRTSESIKALDKYFVEEYGIENRISGELSQRLKLYKDQKFKEKMIEIYKNDIAPKLKEYTKEMVTTSINRHRDLEKKQDAELLDLLDFTDSDLTK